MHKYIRIATPLYMGILTKVS